MIKIRPDQIKPYSNYYLRNGIECRKITTLSVNNDTVTFIYGHIDPKKVQLQIPKDRIAAGHPKLLLSEYHLKAGKCNACDVCETMERT